MITLLHQKLRYNVCMRYIKSCWIQLIKINNLTSVLCTIIIIALCRNSGHNCHDRTSYIFLNVICMMTGLKFPTVHWIATIHNLPPWLRLLLHAKSILWMHYIYICTCTAIKSSSTTADQFCSWGLSTISSTWSDLLQVYVDPPNPTTSRVLLHKALLWTLFKESKDMLYASNGKQVHSRRQLF